MRIKDKEFENFLKLLGKNIKEQRENKGFTQEDMDTDPFQIDYKYYQKIEYGKRNITMSTIFKICKKLNITPKDLFDFDF